MHYVLEKTLKGIRGVRLYDQKIHRAPSLRTKHFKRFNLSFNRQKYKINLIYTKCIIITFLSLFSTNTLYSSKCLRSGIGILPYTN